MGARYREIADDLRQRMASHEWAPGERLPTIAQLIDEYGVPSLNTVRAAQQLLVDEGLIETIAGRGAFVRRVPTRGPEDDLVDRLRQAREAIDSLLVPLSSPRPVPARPVVDEAGLPAWGYMESARCDTCGVDLGGTTRGWVGPDDPLDGDDFGESLFVGHEGHRVRVYLGPDPDADTQQAWLREAWWEHYSHMSRAAVLLAAGDPAAAAYAHRAASISTDNPGLDQIGISLRLEAQ